MKVTKEYLKELILEELQEMRSLRMSHAKKKNMSAANKAQAEDSYWKKKEAEKAAKTKESEKDSDKETGEDSDE